MGRTKQMFGKIYLVLRMSPCMLIAHEDHTNTIQVDSLMVMTHVIALEAGQSSQGTSEPITPACIHFDVNHYIHADLLDI